MPSNFSEFINRGDDDIVFAKLSSFDPIKPGSKIMLVQDGLMGFDAGKLFTVSTIDECNNGQVHRYKGLGEAYLLDDVGNKHIIKAGKDILNNSFILVSTPNEETNEDVKPKTKIAEEPEQEPRTITVVERVVSRGEQGPEGVPGVRGPRGPQGVKGDKGEQGDRGERGEIGPRGPQGSRGEKGERGEQGEKGEKGDSGPQGIEGPQGLRGVQGEKGEKGDRGEPGKNGAEGPKGPQGPSGEKGEKGERGDRGEKGEKGDTGERGERGDRGEKGERGEQGPQGIQGVAGERGAVGEQGPKGDTGEKGDKGDTGEKGEPGPMPFITVQQPLTLKDKRLGIDLTKLRKTIGSGGGGAPVLYDGGGGLGEAFKVISVSGQTDLTAVQYDKETLTIAAGSGISLSTDSGTNTLTIANSGGGGSLGNWGSFWSTEDQIAVTAGTEYQITLNNTDPDSNGVSISNSSRINFAHSGVYSIIYSVQFVNTGNQIEDVDIWLKKNGSNVADTDSRWSVVASHAGVDGHAIGSVNYMLEVNAGDYLELAWKTTHADLSIQYLPAVAPAPAVPSVILTAQQVMYTQVGPTGAQGTTGNSISRLATTSLTGAASFDPRYFTVSGTGHVGLTSSYQVTGDTIVAGTNVTITRNGNAVTVSSSGSSNITVKGAPGSLQFADSVGTDLQSENLVYNYLTDYSLEVPGVIKVGTQYGGFLEFPDGTTQGSACNCSGAVTGSQGNTGPQGTTGEQGIQGIQGVQGNTGPQGTTGEQGIQGPTGATGATGAQGNTGPSEDVLSVFIDSTPDDISTGKKGYRFIPYDCQALEWYVVAGQTGSIQFDVKKSSFTNYPSTASVVGLDYPSLSGQFKNSNTGITAWTGLSAGDMVDFVINSNTGIQSVGLFVKIRRTS